jgi:hypothetical protein
LEGVSVAHGGAAPPIEGTVRDSSGAPLEGARVMIVRAPQAFPDIAALTLSDGRFSLPSAGEGEHEILVVADGYDQARLSVFPRQAPLSLEVALSPTR